jgi:hypothetical protein
MRPTPKTERPELHRHPAYVLTIATVFALIVASSLAAFESGSPMREFAPAVGGIVGVIAGFAAAQQNLLSDMSIRAAYLIAAMLWLATLALALAWG